MRELLSDAFAFGCISFSGKACGAKTRWTI